MKDQVYINSDGVNVYANIAVKAHPVGKAILLPLVGLLCIAFILFACTTPVEDIARAIVPVLVLGAFIVFVPLRYLLWNFLGKEYLIITSKTVSHAYHYGLFTTRLKSKNYGRLSMEFRPEREANGTELGKLAFINYNEVTGLPEELHRTTVLAPKEEIEALMAEIKKTLALEHIEGIAFSEN